MQIPLQIAARNLDLTPADEELIRRRARKLESFHSRITACRVLVDAPQRRRREGRDHVVHIDLTLPGGELVVKRQPEPGLTTAIHGAFDAAERRLEDYARVQRGSVKALRRSPRGRVVRLFPSEGYGFLETPDGREIYFHQNSVLDRGFKRMEVGSEVRFTEEAGEKGPQASTVALRGRRVKRRLTGPQ